MCKITLYTINDFEPVSLKNLIKQQLQAICEYVRGMNSLYS